MRDVYLQVTGLRLYSEKEFQVQGDIYDVGGKRLSSGCSLYLPHDLIPYPRIGDKIRLTFSDTMGRDAVQKSLSDTKEST